MPAPGRSGWTPRPGEFPAYEDADVFVDRLVRRGLLVREVDRRSSERTAQRRTRRSTGLTRRAIGQIERALRAVELVRQGAPLRDVAQGAGYADQAHLTRALKRFVGMTPRQVSLSFKTRPGRFMQHRLPSSDELSTRTTRTIRREAWGRYTCTSS